MGCFGSKEEKQPDGGIIGRHGHVGAVAVGFGAGNYAGGYGGPNDHGWGPTGWGAEDRISANREGKSGGDGTGIDSYGTPIDRKALGFKS